MNTEIEEKEKNKNQLMNQLLSLGFDQLKEEEKFSHVEYFKKEVRQKL